MEKKKNSVEIEIVKFLLPEGKKLKKVISVNFILTTRINLKIPTEDFVKDAFKELVVMRKSSVHSCSLYGIC